MDKLFQNDFNFIISYLPFRIQSLIKKLDYEIIEHIQEIRIRANKPIVIVSNNNIVFMTRTGSLSSIYSSNCIDITQEEITEIVNKICDYSMHSHYEDILNGYISLKNGARVGITGTAVFDKTILKGIRNINGLNFRIPRQIDNCSSVIFNHIFKENISNLLIAGPPSSGKTTILKDLSYQLSSGKKGLYYKICVVDERKELANIKNDIKSLGINTDILYGFPKPVGISIAVRTLSPDIIICDEISPEDVDEIIKSMNSGVNFIFTIHAKNYEELKHKYTYKKLIEYGCIDNVLILNSFKSFTVISNDNIKEVNYEEHCDYNCDYSNSNNFNQLCKKN